MSQMYDKWNKVPGCVDYDESHLSWEEHVTFCKLLCWASLEAQTVKNPPAMQET